MAKRKDRTRDGQKLGPAYHIKSDPSRTASLENKNFGIMARRDKKADKNTVLSSPMDHLRKETPTYTQMYSGKGKNKTKTVQSSWNRNGGKSGNKGSKSGNQPKPMNRDARIMSATLSDSHKRPAIMATDQAKRELEAENDRNNSPMGALRRRARKAQTGQADNYSREDAEKRLFSETLSSARRAEKNYKKAFEENRYTGGSKTLLSGADTKNLSEEDQNDVQVWKDEWDKGQRLIDQGYTQKGKQMQAEAHAQAERIRMTEGYSGGESGSDFTTPEIRQDEYAGMSDSGRKNLRVAKSLYEFGQKTGDEELMKQAAQMGQQVRLEPSSYDYKRSEAYHKFAEDRPVTNPNTDAYGRSIYTPNEWEQEQNKKWGTAVGQGLKGGFLTLLETARKSTQNAIKNRYDPEYQSKKYTAEYLQHEANKEQDEREKIRLNAKAAKMRGEANDAKAKENIGTDTPGMQALRASSEATEDLVNNAKTGGGKLLTKAGISMLQMAPFLAANLIPGAGQAISLGGIGALAAGQKAGELQQDNRVSAQEAFARGLVSGGIEAFTEKIPMDSLLKLVKGGGGTNFIKAVAKQAGIEATEESASYTMNWLADKAARDPKAKFSLSDLAENAAIGAISGAAFGAGGHVIGSAIGAGRTPYNSPSPTEDTTPTPTVEEAPRPIQEQPTQESANPLIRASQAQEQKPTVKEQVAEKRWQRKRLLELNEQERELNERFKSANKRAFSAKTDAEMQEAINEQNEITAERARISNEREELEARLSVPFHPDLQTRTQEAEPVQEPTRSAKERLEAAQQAYRQRIQEQAQANQDTGAQMQSARERLAQARQSLAQREAAWQERAANATEEEVPDLLREQENLLQEERLIQAQEAQAEREDAGQLSRNFGEEAAHIDQRTAGDVSKPSVKAFQWDYPQMHQYYAQAAEALLQDVEYSKAGQFSEKGRGTVVTKSEAMMQAERMGISRADLEKALIAIINDQGQENYATAKKVELVLDEMLSKGYIPNEAGYSANKVDSQVPPNEAYITAKEAIPGAVKRGSFEAYLEQNRLALELGEITEEQLYQEWEQGQTLAQSQAQFEPQSQAQSQAQTQDTQVQQNTDEIPATFDEYKAQFQDVIDSREMTEGQLLDEYNAIRRRNERLQRRGEPIRRTRIEPQYTDPGLRDSLGSARAGFDPYSQAMNRYGTIEPGENPARLVDVPQSMTGSDRVRKFARTAMEAGVTSDKTVELLQKAVVDGEFSYTPKKMDELAGHAIDALSTPQNAAKSMALWEEVVNGDRAVTDDDIALGIMMMKAAEQAGDSRTASQLAGEIAAFGTELGRGVNAMRLLKKATPEGKLFYIRKSVDKLNQNMQRRNKNNKTATKGKNPSDLSDLSYQDITVPDDLAQQLVNAETQEAQDAAIDAIYDYVADRVPKDIVMRMDAWRYFAMLGNPRTHIRNVAGNILMQGVSRSSNATSALLQNIFIKDATKRTRTGVGTMEAHRFAKEDFNKNKDLLTGNPYTTSETGQIMQRVREKAFTVDANKREKNAFWRAVDTAMKPMHKLSNFNTKALDLEDMLFKRSTYIDSMANFLTARGYGKNLDSVPENVLQEARTHAIDDALEATFQQYSELASKLAQMETSNKVGQFLIGGTFPFKRVPINIAKTAVKFSPAGLVKTITSDAKKLRNGDITAADFCDNLGAGLNGSGLAVLGAFLFANGILTVGGDDDDKQAGFDAAMGSQNYAINIGDYSYTIDWAAPAVVPMFIGAEFWNAIKTKDEEASFTKAAMNAVGRMFEPLMQMTMLSGVSSTIKSAAYNQQDPIYGVLANVATNYAGQFVPTALGQVARTIDPIRRTTFADANSKVPKEIQQFLQRQGAKIPGLSQKMPEYLDVWGHNDVGSDNVLLRALENFVSPGYIAKKSGGSVEQELQRLNDAGYEGMLPGAVQKSGKLDGNRMTAEQWMKRQKEQGSTAYEIMQNFIGTQEYQNLTDDQKAKFIDKAYEFAKNKGKAAAGGDTSDFAKWYNAAENAQSEVGLSEEKFLSIYAYKSAIEDEAGDDAKASIKQGMWEDYVNGRSDLSQDQKDYVLDQVKFWSMIPADSGAYQKAKSAGYDTPQEIQALLEAKKGFDTDGNGSYSAAELYEGIKKATSDPAEQEKMWNATKNANMDKTWSEVAKEQAAKEPQRQKGEQALNSLSDDKKQAFASAGEQYNTNSYNGIYDTVMSVDATDAEREAYYNYINSRRSNPWKKSWAEAKAKVEKERKSGK